MPLSDNEIIERVATQNMIEPFEARQVRESQGITLDGRRRVVSYGTSSYGYDARLAPEFRVFTPIHGAIIDPKNFDPEAYVEKRGESCLIPPHSFVLATTLEYFRIPRDILVICVGKSTYARCGIFLGVTPLEPEWEGNVTIEIANVTDLPARIYANEGFGQFIFLRADRECAISYADRKGKYQAQHGIVNARV
jgi:dCTP deaminase